MVEHTTVQTSTLRQSLTRYDLDPGYFSKFLKDQTVRNIVLNKNPANLLDAGCDTGYMNALLKHSGWKGKYLGLDYRDSYNTDFLNPDEEFIKTQNMIQTISSLEEFDTILLLDIVEHMKDKNEGLELLETAYSKLAPNGILIITTPNCMNGQLNWPKYHEYEYSLDEILEKIHQLGITEDILMGWSASDDQYLKDQPTEHTHLPTQIMRAIWAIDNPKKSRDVLITINKK